ncbi:MAG: hypothetical protein PHE26_01745 [Syntrophomonadaceae bacterium]|nr:hypothetical protein [Syntrophomonadaceae bacterium]
MPLEEVKNNTARVIGSKQVKKALAKGGVKKVYIASDAEHHIIEPIKNFACSIRLSLKWLKVWMCWADHAV